MTEEERQAVQAQLAAARDALHRLEIGQMEVSVSYNGETLSFAAADRASLRNHIRSLEVQLGLRTIGRARSRGVVFG